MVPEVTDMGYSIFDETMVDMNWPAIEKAAADNAVVLLPTGIIEEHGPHMELAVDTYIAYLLSVLTKRQLDTDGTPAIIAPPVYWGISASTATFGGTFSVRKETMQSIIYDILASLISWHFSYAFVINWHADFRHCLMILETLKEARQNVGIDARYVLSESDAGRYRLDGTEPHILVMKSRPPSLPATEFADYHAGSLETGIMLAYFPKNVDVNLAKKLEATHLTDADLKGLGGNDEEIRRLIPGGYFGNPSGYDVDFARRYMEENARILAETVSDYLKNR
jgi:creatinine amidohydrolase